MGILNMTKKNTKQAIEHTVFVRYIHVCWNLLEDSEVENTQQHVKAI